MKDALLAVYRGLPGPVRSLAASAHGWYLSSWRYGPDAERLVEEVVERESWTGERWKTLQEERLAALLEHAAPPYPSTAGSGTSAAGRATARRSTVSRAGQFFRRSNYERTPRPSSLTTVTCGAYTTSRRAERPARRCTFGGADRLSAPGSHCPRRRAQNWRHAWKTRLDRDTQLAAHRPDRAFGRLWKRTSVQWPDDIAAMSAAVRRLFAEPDLARRLSSEARHQAERFDWSVVMSQWRALLAGGRERP